MRGSGAGPQPADTTREILNRLFGKWPRGFAVRLWGGTYWPQAAGPASSWSSPIPVRCGGCWGTHWIWPWERASSAEASMWKEIRKPRSICWPAPSPPVPKKSWPSRAWPRVCPGAPDRHLLATPGATTARRAAFPRARPPGHRPPLRRRQRPLRLWLDRRLVYSCAYFPHGNEDVDAAQEAKLELICRKLRLRPTRASTAPAGCSWPPPRTGLPPPS